MDFPSDFFIDILVFIALFTAFYASVAGIKAAYLWLKRYLKKFFPEKHPVPVRRPKRKKPTAIRSIEIDPEEVDRIYVKKIS